ncbi:unnamed protein product [Notodromas monacha]|uniref:Palmitoyltransferase n=1 Tax=Notodromas monacha TaxID=399045 RepID=A0A7R9GIT7_9CRUS|nr:unnamed protein product [Notodromas monacha]CAG0924163.1 unnamed protein product [Notodromas monacha]
MTWGLLLYAGFVVVVVILPWEGGGFPPLYNFINLVVFNCLAFLAAASHARAMLTDPGAVPKGNATREMMQKMGFEEGEVVFKCPKCCSIKPERAHHCSICQRCIKKMDHHCPWVNNCVGEKNQKYFVLFTFYIAVISVHALFLCVNHFIYCVNEEWRGAVCSKYSPPASVIFMLFLLIEGLLFAIFTAIMFGSQISAIWNDETGIEALKKEYGSWTRQAKWKSVQAVFGEKFGLSWFSPFSSVQEVFRKSRYYSV